MSPTGNTPGNFLEVKGKKKEKSDIKNIEVTDSKELKSDKDETLVKELKQDKPVDNKPTPETPKKKVKKEIVKDTVKKIQETAQKRLDDKIAKRLKVAVYSKQCPLQHFHGNGIEAQLELAMEAAKQMLIDNHWECETFTDSKGIITHAIFVTKK